MVCLRTAAQYLLLFLVRFNNSDRFQFTELHALTLAARSYALLTISSIRFNNSDQFQIYVVTRSYSSHPFLCTLVGTYRLLANHLVSMVTCHTADKKLSITV